MNNEKTRTEKLTPEENTLYLAMLKSRRENGSIILPRKLYQAARAILNKLEESE